MVSRFLSALLVLAAGACSLDIDTSIQYEPKFARMRVLSLASNQPSAVIVHVDEALPATFTTTALLSAPDAVPAGEARLAVVRDGSAEATLSATLAEDSVVTALVMDGADGAAYRLQLVEEALTSDAQAAKVRIVSASTGTASLDGVELGAVGQSFGTWITMPPAASAQLSLSLESGPIVFPGLSLAAGSLTTLAVIGAQPQQLAVITENPADFSASVQLITPVSP